MEGLGEKYQILSYKLYNTRDLTCHVHPLDNLICRRGDEAQMQNVIRNGAALHMEGDIWLIPA